ncbi:ibr domain-containing protein [Pyrenophora teres f. maculata]|nr:ibr domain-containing protein [Pyrenophora teres f. maculata]
MSSTPTVGQKTMGASKTARAWEDNAMLVADMESLQLNEDATEYECCICGDDLPLSKGIATCAEHVMCHQCVVDAHDIALKDNEAFPVECCAPIPFELVQHLLSPEKREAYSKKLQEHNTPIHSRVYCSQGLCSSFIPRTQFDSTSFTQTVARCPCGCVTCTECRKEWNGEGHKCLKEYDNALRPKWLPEYSATCRIKRCLYCPAWIELKEACNHMRCNYCRSDFCFICMNPWTGFHVQIGCPVYGDPPVGYDEEGFELSWRGLHFETGLDRNGYDLFDLTVFDGGDEHGLSIERNPIVAEHDDPFRVLELDDDLGVEHIEQVDDQDSQEFWANVEGLVLFFG